MESYGGCTNDADVELYVIEGGGHTWPGASRDIALLGDDDALDQRDGDRLALLLRRTRSPSEGLLNAIGWRDVNSNSSAGRCAPLAYVRPVGWISPCEIMRRRKLRLSKLRP